MLKATSSGLRQQSVARRAVIKVSSLPKILPSVVFCTTLKPNEQFSGNSVWVQQRQRRIHIVDLLSQLSLYLYLPVFNSAQSSGITIGNFIKQNIPSWSSRMDRQLDEKDSAEK